MIKLARSDARCIKKLAEIIDHEKPTDAEGLTICGKIIILGGAGTALVICARAEQGRTQPGHEFDQVAFCMRSVPL